jgi:hypothetical protein
MTQPSLVIAAAIIAVCVVFRVPLEGQMVTHVLLLLPALAFAGWLAGRAIASRWPGLRSSDWNADGATGLLTALFAGAFWMLPRSLDWSLSEPLGDVAKFISLPLLVGIPLALSWRRAPFLVRGFLKANAISMALTLAWIYSYAPVRLCISYLTGQQEQLGVGFLWVAGVISALWIAPLLGVPLPPWSARQAPSLAAGHHP